MDNHDIQLTGKDILLIGAGGAVRGVLESILEQKPASLLITNRTADKAIRLADDFSDLGNIKGCGLNDTESTFSHSDFDIVINGTSASLKGDLPALPDSIFRENSCSYDMMYSAIATPFMQWSIDNGTKNAFDGLGMLVEQAAESFYLWRKVKPETRQVIKYIRKLLNK